MAGRLDFSKNQLEKNLRELISAKDIPGNKLYEVTQLINSMMGIAVLPYEMHKEYFDSVIEDKKSDDNRGKSTRDIQDEVKYGIEYNNLFVFIMDLHRKKKWVTTYNCDLSRDGGIKEDVIVFRFLRHLRNTVCHSGDDALSILPLDDGQVIEEVLFYDTLGQNENKEEFAMRLPIEDVEKLVELVADFYKNSKIGNIDKTKRIAETEQKVALLLDAAIN